MQISSQQFSKLCRDAGLTGGRLTPAAVDLCFAKAKARGARKLGFDAFLDALALVAQAKGAEGERGLPEHVHLGMWLHPTLPGIERESAKKYLQIGATRAV